MRAALLAATAALLSSGCTGECQHHCTPRCENGIEYRCNVLTPGPLPGQCGAEAGGQQICKYGCSGTVCAPEPWDGGWDDPRSCDPGKVTVQTTTALGQGTPKAYQSTLGGTDQIILASSGTAACASTPDAGAGPVGEGSVIRIGYKSLAGGKYEAVGSATLSTWKDGVWTTRDQVATAGTVTFDMEDVATSTLMGSYDLEFGTVVEKGSYIAVGCDFCKHP